MLETDKALHDFATKGVETNKILTNHIRAREFDIAGNREKAMMMLGKNVELCEDFMRKFSGKENELMADMQTAMTKGSGYVSTLMIYLFYLNSIDPEKAKETLEYYKKNYPEVSELLDGIGEMAMFPDQWRKRFPL